MSYFLSSHNLMQARVNEWDNAFEYIKRFTFGLGPKSQRQFIVHALLDIKFIAFLPHKQNKEK